MDAERVARLCLATIVEPGRPELAAAVAEYGAAPVWESLATARTETPLAVRARQVDPDRLVAQLASARLRFVIPTDPEWPPQLGDLACCEPVNRMAGEPIGLWVSGGGQLASQAAEAVSIVGARAATGYGETVAADLAAELSQAGRSVVSGGAYGIDAAAHRGCLAGAAGTICVLASGLDQPYPSGNRRLFDRITESGVLVSELAPSEHPTRMRFLARNRLIAALGAGTVLVEAATRSGARNTVTWANALNRVVMAVPGPVTSATSQTPNRLIRDAEAVLVGDAAQVQELLAPLGRYQSVRTKVVRFTDELTPDELTVYELVPGRGSRSAGDLALRAGIGMPRCLAVLDQLAERGLLRQGPDGWQLNRSARGPRIGEAG